MGNSRVRLPAAAQKYLTKMEKEQWLMERRKGIGGSDIAAILGLTPKWKTPYQVWEEKTGRSDGPADNPQMKAGRKLEPVVVEYFQEGTGLKTAFADFIRYPGFPFILGTPDRIVILPSSEGILEIKTTGAKIDKQDIPHAWFCQVQWYAGIRQAIIPGTCEMNYIAWFERQSCLFDYLELPFNPAFFQYLVKQATEFWGRYVLEDTPPAPMNARDVLSQWPRHKEGVIINATGTCCDIIDKLREARRRRKDAEDEVEGLEDAIKLAMRDAETLLVDGTPAVTWRAGKDTQMLDIARMKEENIEIYNKYQITKPGVRRFLLK